MSAFIVDPAHVDLILSVAIRGPRDFTREPSDPWGAPYVNELLEGNWSGPLGPQQADPAGAVLLAECIASVAYRYSDPDPFGLPGPMPTPDPKRYEWTDFGPILTAIEACKAIDCYEYQSCEHPGWSTSGAKAFCERLRRALIGAMPGYQQAEWHWSTELALARAPRDLRFDALR